MVVAHSAQPLIPWSLVNARWEEIDQEDKSPMDKAFELARFVQARLMVEGNKEIQALESEIMRLKARINAMKGRKPVVNPLSEEEQKNLARGLRLIAVRGYVESGAISEDMAKELLDGPLSPGDSSSVVEDSSLLHATTEELTEALQFDINKYLP